MRIPQILHNMRGCLGYSDLNGFGDWLTRARDELDPSDFQELVDIIVSNIEHRNAWPNLTKGILEQLRIADPSGHESRRARIDRDYIRARKEEEARKLKDREDKLRAQEEAEASERARLQRREKALSRLKSVWVIAYSVLCLGILLLLLLFLWNCLLFPAFWFVLLPFGLLGFFLACRGEARGGRSHMYLSVAVFLGISVFGLTGKPEYIEVTGPRIGAIAMDGWRSDATGRGAASHHGGVRHWIYKKTRRPLTWYEHSAWHLAFTATPVLFIWLVLWSLNRTDWGAVTRQ